MKKRFISRRVEVTDAQGKKSVYSLSVITVDLDAEGIVRNVDVTPFEKEIAGVEYIDHTLHIQIGRSLLFA